KADAAKPTDSKSDSTSDSKNGDPQKNGQDPPSSNVDEDKKKASPEKTKTAKPPKKTTKKAVPKSNQGKRSSAGTKPPSLLAKGWRLRDKFLDRSAGDGWSPVDDAPHLWREFQDLLLGYDVRSRAGAAYQDWNVKGKVKEYILTLEELDQRTRPPSSSRGGVVDQLTAARPYAMDQVNRPHSLGLAPLLADPFALKPTAEVQSLNETARSLLEELRGTRFSEWVQSGEPRRHRRFAEIALAIRLEPLAGSEWRLVKLALETRLAAEKTVAAAAGLLPWIQEDVRQADRDRVEGERLLIQDGERLTDDQRQTIRAKLRSAADRYRAAGELAETARKASRLKNQLVFLSPDLVHGFALTAEAPLGRWAQQQTLADLLEKLGGLQDKLESPDSAARSELNTLHNQLRGKFQGLKDNLRETVAALRRAPNAPGAA
ncbi:MAG: hypothetical protein N2C14_05410, partial [Planctomycetales bacterium]